MLCQIIHFDKSPQWSYTITVSVTVYFKFDSRFFKSTIVIYYLWTRNNFRHTMVMQLVFRLNTIDMYWCITYTLINVLDICLQWIHCSKCNLLDSLLCVVIWKWLLASLYIVGINPSNWSIENPCQSLHHLLLDLQFL